ncbi:hypothetical protein TSOC_009307 [Tetrabaena socialis]|uniref:Replication factor A C-terminal domain-containing protein n=1 Tax=Tetrabaena socialis TaxID=47790 RepID=A0A2J7ZW67_9CHLO|nr:hypothetical protein TSOC_009307 [Tetrabaena socialis]|eukprot:PNH04519.1 hypothetical protein TSOC_009307 [Tetrabaena socialis]
MRLCWLLPPPPLPTAAASTIYPPPHPQAEAVMGMKADDLAALKEAGGEGFAAAVRAAAWKPWSLVLMSKAREYQGNKSMRHTVHRLDPVDWVGEGMRLAGLISKYGVA